MAPNLEEKAHAAWCRGAPLPGLEGLGLGQCGEEEGILSKGLEGTITSQGGIQWEELSSHKTVSGVADVRRQEPQMPGK